MEVFMPAKRIDVNEHPALKGAGVEMMPEELTVNRHRNLV
jgi:hypothetical protein